MRRVVLWSAIGGVLLTAALLWRQSGRGGEAERPRAAAVPVVDAAPTPTLVPLATVFARTPTPASGAEAAAPEQTGCRIVERGTLPDAGAVGHPFASHLHVSYWLDGAAAERDVMLPGGLWQAGAGVAAGRYRVYAGCTDKEVQRKIQIYQRQANREEPGINAGWGDPRIFDPVAADP